MISCNTCTIIFDSARELLHITINKIVITIFLILPPRARFGVDAAKTYLVMLMYIQLPAFLVAHFFCLPYYNVFAMGIR